MPEGKREYYKIAPVLPDQIAPSGSSAVGAVKSRTLCDTSALIVDGVTEADVTAAAVAMGTWNAVPEFRDGHILIPQRLAEGHGYGTRIADGLVHPVSLPSNPQDMKVLGQGIIAYSVTNRDPLRLGLPSGSLEGNCLVTTPSDSLVRTGKGVVLSSGVFEVNKRLEVSIIIKQGERSPLEIPDSTSPEELPKAA